MCHNGVLVGGGMYRKFGVAEDYWKVTGSQTIDNGRADVTKKPDDLYVFRVASLRNVAMTAPYFHDGSVATLPEAIRVMARVQLGVTLGHAETSDIVAFLESLTGELPANFALPSGAVTPPRELRSLRAVEVLEWVATKEARARLLELTKGAPGARLTRAAAAACKRLEGRK